MKKYLTLVLIAFLIVLTGCKLSMPYNATIINEGYEFDKTFLENNKTKIKDESLPEERVYYIKDQDTLDGAFISFPKVNFDKEMIVIYGFTTSYNAVYELEKVEYKNKQLTIEYKTKQIKENKDLSTEWIVLKMNKLTIDTINVNK